MWRPRGRRPRPQRAGGVPVLVAGEPVPRGAAAPDVEMRRRHIAPYTPIGDSGLLVAPDPDVTRGSLIRAGIDARELDAWARFDALAERVAEAVPEQLKPGLSCDRLDPVRLLAGQRSGAEVQVAGARHATSSGQNDDCARVLLPKGSSRSATSVITGRTLASVLARARSYCLWTKAVANRACRSTRARTKASLGPASRHPPPYRQTRKARSIRNGDIRSSWRVPELPCTARGAVVLSEL